jgi:predicted deacetylase
MINKKKILILLVLLIVLILFFIRLINPREIDDVTPGISCDEKYLKKSDVLWVIPNFNNTKISENASWCNEILNLNKTIEMHGVTHTFNEFKEDRTPEYLENGVEIFQDCFGFPPTSFKPPHLKISEYNKQLIKNNGLQLKTRLNQVLHKVYHCNDAGELSNKLIDLF